MLLEPAPDDRWQFLAGRLLRDAPASLTIAGRQARPRSSVLAVGQINWGDFPTWVAVVVAAAGGTVALIQLRLQRKQLEEQSKTLEGEIARNKRRDELLDGQLQELKERADDRAREQVDRIIVSVDEAPLTLDPAERVTIQAMVENQSPRAITHVRAGYVEALPSGGDTTRHPRDWYGSDHGKDWVVRDTDTLSVLKPESTAGCTFPGLLCPHIQEAERVHFRFYDDAGRRWDVSGLMHVDRAPVPNGDW
jgi:hypothetical protein